MSMDNVTELKLSTASTARAAVYKLVDILAETESEAEKKEAAQAIKSCFNELLGIALTGN